MKRHPRFLLFFIILLTVVAIIIDVPKTKPLHVQTPKLPGINRKISFDVPIAGSTIGKWEFPFRKGLDLAGGTSVTLRADMKNIAKDQRQNALDAAKLVLDRRVNLFGVSEPTLQTAQVGQDYRIIVDLPGIDINQAVSLIGTTAELSFWEEGASGSGSLRDFRTLPIGILQTLGPDAKKTNLTGKDVKNATAGFDQQSGNPEVQIAFNADGTKKFGDLTTRNVGKPIVIVLDNQVVTSPIVQTPIVDGNAVINGNFTLDQVKAVSTALQAGALPVPLSILEQHTVGATLGQDSLQKSLFAGVLGLIIIILFMSLLYRGLGIIASFALLVYTLFVLAIFKIVPVTLTLAGIAGFILSIGMAVDANILIFERTKEELRHGKTKSAALELGFTRAWSSIRDSNISTLITSGILYYFGTGIVRGFALTLAIGVLVSMFSAIVVTRTFLRVFMKR
jgi:preprotein translocase subunit SecD